MTKRLSSLPMKKLCGALLLAGIQAWSGNATANVYAVDVTRDDTLTRLQLLADIGNINNVGLDGQGRQLVLELKKADAKALEAMVAEWRKRYPDIIGVQFIPGQEGSVQMVVQFQKRQYVLDQTVMAVGKERSRWEIALTDQAPAKQQPAVVVKPELKEISLENRGGKLQIVLKGSSALVAEAVFWDNPSRLVVDLPNVPSAQIIAAAAQVRGVHPLVKAVRLGKGGAGSWLVFELNGDADLVDTGGQATHDEAMLSMSLVADGSVRHGGGVQTIAVETTGNRMALLFDGLHGAKTNSFMLNDPPRMVVDLIGVDPERALEALLDFQPGSGILGAHVEMTRIGSARVVFDLAGSVSQFDTLALDATPASRRFSVAMNVPTPDPALPVRIARSDMPTSLDLRYRKEMDSMARKPAIVIRPVMLTGREESDAKGSTTHGADSLMGMLEQAMDQDSKYQAAKADFRATIEAKPQARAAYLPTASFDYQLSHDSLNISKAANASFPTGTANYQNQNWSLNITQPVFKMPALFKLEQADISIEQSNLNVVAAEQDLIMRLAGASLGLLAARDGVELADAEHEATSKQLEQARTRIKSGLGSMPELREAEARFALTESRKIEAHNKLDDAYQGVQEITGKRPPEVRGFKGDFEAVLPQPASIDAWLNAAEQQNLAVQSRRMSMEIASLEIRRQRAGHMPTVNLVGSVSGQNAGGSIYGGGQESTTNVIGVKLSVPLTDGGMTTSLTREAIARKDKAEHELEQERRHTERLARQAFNSLESSVSSLAALRKGVAAQASAMQLKVDGYNAGIYTIVQVLDAHRLYYAAKRDYLQARYDYLVNRLRLKMAVGSLNRGDLEDIAVMMN